MLYHKENFLRICRMVSSDHRKRLMAGNNITCRSTKQPGFLDSVFNNRRHIRINQTHYRLKETQEKFKMTKQRIKESKQRIINDIKDTKTMMKERMENIIEVFT